MQAGASTQRDTTARSPIGLKSGDEAGLLDAPDVRTIYNDDNKVRILEYKFK